MARRKKNRQPISLTIDRLELKGSSGLDAAGRRWVVRGAAVGESVTAWPARKGKAKLIDITAPAPGAVTPQCPVFGICGGCQLQRMSLPDQRTEKAALVARSVGALEGVAVHPIQGAPQGYGYRNKLELSFGPRQFVPEADKDDPASHKPGSFLGFHPRGWFSRIVPITGCALASAAMNEVIALVAAADLSPPWSSQSHTGVWRHVVVREGDGVLVSLVTSSSADPAQVRALGQALGALEAVVGVVWVVTDRLSDVAEGDLAEVLCGRPWLNVAVGDLSLQLPHDGFFQVNNAGAQILFATIAQALQPTGSGTLLDLYCGVGAIGLSLAGRFARLIGVELNPASVACAQDNAARCGIPSEWHAGKVEDILPQLALSGPRWIVVDPPRVGLHPAAARFLAQQSAEALVYVACNPGSLGRDRALLEAGGWRMEALWSVDLFPQTPHVEAVARFVRA